MQNKQLLQGKVGRNPWEIAQVEVRKLNSRLLFIIMYVQDIGSWCRYNCHEVFQLLGRKGLIFNQIIFLMILFQANKFK